MQKIELNLLPLEYRVSKMDHSWVLDRKIMYPLFTLILLVVVCMLLTITMKQGIAEKEAKIVVYNKNINKLKPILNDIKELEKTLKTRQKKTKALKSIQVSKAKWIALFEDISTIMPSNMWLTEINESKVDANVISLKGVTFNFSDVSSYMLNLERQQSFHKVKLMSILTIKQQGGTTAYQFEMICNLNIDVGSNKQS